jgi:hypothetical protein
MAVMSFYDAKSFIYVTRLSSLRHCAADIALQYRRLIRNQQQDIACVTRCRRAA